MGQFSGKVAVITGGGSGVGKATAARFLAEGARVAIAGRDVARLRTAAAELGGGDDLIYHACDVSHPEQAEALIRAALARFGRIDVLVNNAGTNIKARTFRELTPAAWDMMIRVNLDGAFYCTKAAFPHMAEQKDGVIVNVVSVAGKRANPLGGPAYVAAKYGMGAMGMALANEEKDSGVRVSNIYPGEIDTPILEQRPRPVSEEQRAAILKADDVADAIVYVAGLPPRVSVPELIIKPTSQPYF